ncbi:hypothetical protein B0A52_05403 [Exophiala mesophila]|uniref:Gfo/Idh/MocA-like oxidoreductase N-terminal domain-containing protein n=1 Tax=Exophiala mesophila TaxID=212818 RepID=A0A438N4R5_EXOME|nr:hypothetical protein B0A52_05403 [Exophiala mesophila]
MTIESIGVAILGGGIFAREEHVPAVDAVKNLALKAAWSRSLKSVKTLEVDTSKVDLYSEDSAPGKQLDDLLTRSDIKAVIIALPIKNQPEYIRKSLLAGKHVLSEKPVAENVVEAAELIKWYHAEITAKTDTTWAVAENQRYLDSFEKAANAVKTKGRQLTFRLRMQTLVTGGKYFETSWRKVPTHQGGFLLDGGVHFVAGLRYLLGKGNPIMTISAHSAQLQDHLPPVDTVDATARTKNGAIGTLSISFGTTAKGTEWTIGAEDGVVSIIDNDLTIDGNKQDFTNERSGVPPEVRAWGEALAAGSIDARQTPEEALADLELIEAMLVSGGKPVELKYQDTATTDKMVSAKKHVPIVKKHPKKWNRHQSDTFKCVPSAWRKPKGIDNRVRRRFKGQLVMPSIGFGSNKKTRHLIPSGHKVFLVRNPNDVDLLLLHNRTYAAEIASAVSSRKRIEIIAKAKALGVKVTNPKAKITTES